MKRYDVIVVGAGPAGSTAARHCSQRDLKTLLLEKHKIPRYKACGGGVTSRAYRELGFEIPERIIERECRGARFQVKDVKNEVRDSETVIYMVSRDRFDEFLVQKAAQEGAEVHDGEECLAVEIEERVARVDTNRGSYQANIIIGADGCYSRVLSSINKKIDEKKFCAICEIPLQEEEIDERMGDCVIIHFGVIDKGYAWIFPKRNYISAGIGSTVSKIKDLPHKLREFLKLHHLPTDIRINGWFIPLSAFNSPVYERRVMLVGDAAGFVDPLTGEGISYAVLSGRFAALTALSCHVNDDFSNEALSVYQEQCLEEFRENLGYASRAADLLLGFTDLVPRGVARNSDAIRYYLKTLKGEMDYKSYARWFKKHIPNLLFSRIFSS